jgi:TRAP-type mannitol/chloroaromatic compound transport system substrate-binding protein
MPSRRFFAKASGAMAAVVATNLIDSPDVIAQPKVQWRMSTAYPPTLDVQRSTSERLAQIVDETTGGRFARRSRIVIERHPTISGEAPT